MAWGQWGPPTQTKYHQPVLVPWGQTVAGVGYHMEDLPGVPTVPPTGLCSAMGPDLRSPTGPGCVRSWEAHGPVPRTWAGASPALPSWSPTTRSPTCTLPLDQFRCNVFYEHADGMARARGKVLPWDKKLTLANSKFTACIFIFLIPAPSASNWGSTSLFSPLFLQPALF